MPTLNTWIRAEEFEGLEVAFVTRPDVVITWSDDLAFFKIIISQTK